MTPGEVLEGDCIEVMATLDAESVDAIVTDPPYGLEFMGKEWDRIDTRQPGDPTYVSVDNPYGRSKVRHGAAASYGVSSAQAQQSWHETWAREAFRVAKPGAHLLAFGGTRTYHRLACAIEDAGWEIRDCLVWAYASGFPKSLDVSKAIDKAAGAERAVVGFRESLGYPDGGTAVERNRQGTTQVGMAVGPGGPPLTAPATPEAAKWQGWGTALKPAWEPIVLARKPLRGTVAANVTAYGTGALNIAATRIGAPTDDPATSRDASGSSGAYSSARIVPWLEDESRRDNPSTLLRAWSDARPEADSARLANALADAFVGRGVLGSRGGYPSCRRCGDGLARIAEAADRDDAPLRPDVPGAPPLREWSASRIRESRCDDHRATWDELARLVEAGGVVAYGNDTTLDVQQGRWPPNLILTSPIFDGDTPGVVGGGEQSGGGNPARRIAEPGNGVTMGGGWHKVETGLTPVDTSGSYSRFFLVPKADRADREPVLLPDGHDRDKRFTTHPTVKPTELMRHLVRLVTPPGGIVLDPFLGSGTTALAAEMEGFRWLGIEREPEYVAIARARLNGTQRGLGLVG